MLSGGALDFEGLRVERSLVAGRAVARVLLVGGTVGVPSTGWDSEWVGVLVGRRYVARGVSGGYRIWDNRGRRWWGELYEVCPDELLAELNGRRDYARVTALLRRYRALKR